MKKNNIKDTLPNGGFPPLVLKKEVLNNSKEYAFATKYDIINIQKILLTKAPETNTFIKSKKDNDDNLDIVDNV